MPKVVYIDGEPHKLCRGPTHAVPEIIPINRYYLEKSGIRAGKPRPRCIECERRERNVEKYVNIRDYMFAITELVNRVGLAEAARRIEITYKALHDIRKGRTDYMQRRYARNLILALYEARKIDEVRHRDSISHGASARGRKEKKVTNKARQIYHTYRDEDSENRRKLRRKK